MLKVKIVHIEKKHIIATGEPYLDVEAKFTVGKEVFVKKLGFPVGTTEKEMTAELRKHLFTEHKERKQRENELKAEAQDAATDKIISNLEGEEIVVTEAETAQADKAKAKKSGSSKTKGKKS